MPSWSGCVLVGRGRGRRPHVSAQPAPPRPAVPAWRPPWRRWAVAFRRDRILCGWPVGPACGSAAGARARTWGRRGWQGTGLERGREVGGRARPPPCLAARGNADRCRRGWARRQGGTEARASCISRGGAQVQAVHRVVDEVGRVWGHVRAGRGAVDGGIGRGSLSPAHFAIGIFPSAAQTPRGQFCSNSKALSDPARHTGQPLVTRAFGQIDLTPPGQARRQKPSKVVVQQRRGVEHGDVLGATTVMV